MMHLGGRPVVGFGLGAWVVLEAPFRLVRNTRYAATINLSWAESTIATNALVAEKFTSKGFTGVTVDLPNKRVEGTWSGNDQTVILPEQVTAVWRLEPPSSDPITPPIATPPPIATSQPPPIAAASEPPPIAATTPPSPETPSPITAVMPPPLDVKDALEAIEWIKAHKTGIAIGATILVGSIVYAIVRR